MLQMAEPARFKTWLRKYQPLQNPWANLLSPYVGLMFETVGPEIQYAADHDRLRPNTVWTLIQDEGNGRTYIVPGWRRVNRLGYFLCTIPYADAEEANAIPA